MLWLIDSCQINVFRSPVLHVDIAGSDVELIAFFNLNADQVIAFDWIASSSLFINY